MRFFKTACKRDGKILLEMRGKSQMGGGGRGGRGGGGGGGGGGARAGLVL